MSYNNPIPVAVNVVPVRRKDGTVGLLGITRGEVPFVGEDALPGGFTDEMESLEMAAAREFKEETGYETVPNQWVLLSSAITPNNRVLVFCEFKGELTEDDVANMVPNPEVRAFKVLNKDSKLCFGLHQALLQSYLPA